MATMQKTTVSHEGPSNLFQSPESDGIALLVSQHIRFRSLVQQINAATDFHARCDLVFTLMREEIAHTSSEERYVHGLYEKYLGAEGKRFYEDSLRDDNEAKATWEVIRALGLALKSGELKADAPVPSKYVNEETRTFTNALQVWEHYVTKIIQALTSHMKDEESIFWPRLAAVMSAAELKTLRENLLSAQASAPTHPHSEGPSGVVGAKIMHPAVGMMDRAMDAVTGEGAGLPQTIGKPAAGLPTGQTK